MSFSFIIKISHNIESIIIIAMCLKTYSKQSL